MKYLVSILAAILLVGGVYMVEKSYTEKVEAPAGIPEIATTTQPAMPVAPASTTVSEGVASGMYTLEEVAKHADRDSCWSAINGVVYDLTTWIDKHPGGAKRILSICGKDGSSAFQNQHEGAPKPEAMLATFKLGDLE